MPTAHDAVSGTMRRRSRFGVGEREQGTSSLLPAAAGSGSLLVGAVIAAGARRPSELGTITEIAAALERVESFITTAEWASAEKPSRRISSG